jgi:hypothetical protein
LGIPHALLSTTQTGREVGVVVQEIVEANLRFHEYLLILVWTTLAEYLSSQSRPKVETLTHSPVGIVAKGTCSC